MKTISSVRINGNLLIIRYMDGQKEIKPFKSFNHATEYFHCDIVPTKQNSHITTVFKTRDAAYYLFY